MQDTIAVVFDFDETLAPDSTSSFLNSLGIDVQAFWQQKVEPLIADGWDSIPAYLYVMLQESCSGDPSRVITKQKLSDWGKQVRLYNGATRVFSRLRQHAESVSANTSVEFYLISSGIGEILRSTRVAKYFTDIWACDFAYDEQGRIQYPKNVVSFTDKTRYVFHIAKGIFGPDSRGRPFEVNRKIPPDKLRVPMDQMIIVGDGYTDIPCFSLIRKNDGVAIGVYDPAHPKRWGRAWGFVEDGRVSNLVPADFRKNSALMNSLIMAVDSIARRIELRRNTYQG